MKNRCLPALALASLAACLPHAAVGQALPTATKTASIQAGVGGQYLDNDYTGRHNAGPYIFIDYNFLHLFRIEAGLEVEARFGGLYSPDDIGENSYLIGPRFNYRRHALNLYAKVMVGRATIFHNAPLNNTSSSFNAFAYGAGAEYLVKRHFNIRVIDFEQQKWPDFEPNTLSPFAISAGLAYVIR